MEVKKWINKIYNSNHIHSFISSTAGTLASVFFKKSSDFSTFIYDKDIITTSFITQIIIRIIYIFLFILCNMIMLKHYVLLMKHYSAFYATVLNFSLNFFLSALCGIVFFHEKRKFFWFFGVTLIICGLVFILKDITNEEKIKINKNK
ncbi:putative membrane protein [Plasmodium gaboni]|uniref:Putative membrane protein n=1 Tax=Plasmodium gaboni TaxID=647221 RepID=A0A151LJ55_9APIC|nr:putative membrane protein [Plasmodium gaboni]KYN99020.1 putative membrane protein [Plasmodium gaboni]